MSESLARGRRARSGAALGGREKDTNRAGWLASWGDGLEPLSPDKALRSRANGVRRPRGES